MEILFDEHVGIDRMTGHGGLFKTPMIGQQIMSAAVKAPVTVMQTAGEGGAWGIGLLALYMLDAAGEESTGYIFKSKDIFRYRQHAI